MGRSGIRTEGDGFAVSRDVVVALAGAGALLLAVALLDVAHGDRGFLLERRPDWSPVSLLRSVCIAAGSSLAVVAARRLTGGSIRGEPVEVGREVVAAGAIGAGIGLGAAALVLTDPGLLTSLVEEDGPVEWLTALLAFAAAPMIGVAARRMRRSSSTPATVPIVGLLAIAAMVSLLIGLEEVSWFQRVFDFDSPAAFEDRNQQEFNLHNGATALSENVYYIGAFLVLAAVPALLAGRRLPGPLAGLEPIMPGRLVFYGSVPAAALVYEMWEIIPIQAAFFASLGLLLTDGATERGRRLGPTMAAALIGIVAIFLIFGDEMTRSWDDTEVRELFPTYGLLLYGWELLRRTGEPSPAPSVLAAAAPSRPSSASKRSR